MYRLRGLELNSGQNNLRAEKPHHLGSAQGHVAERELDVRFRPVDETLRNAVAGFRAHGYVNGAAPRDTSQAAPRSPRV